MAKQDDDVQVSEAGSPGGHALPSLGRRFGALMVDWVLCLLVSYAFAEPAREGWPPVVLLIAFYALFVGLFTATPGMWLTRVRCVSVRDAGPIGVLRGALRGVLLCLVVPALIMDAYQRGLHDRAAGSIMIAAQPAAAPRDTA